MRDDDEWRIVNDGPQFTLMHPDGHAVCVLGLTNHEDAIRISDVLNALSFVDADALRAWIDFDFKGMMAESTTDLERSISKHLLSDNKKPVHWFGGPDSLVDFTYPAECKTLDLAMLSVAGRLKYHYRNTGVRDFSYLDLAEINIRPSASHLPTPLSHHVTRLLAEHIAIESFKCGVHPLLDINVLSLGQEDRENETLDNQVSPI